jgi:hypothetical protein
MRSDAQLQVATTTPSTTVKSEATSADQGSSSSLMRADAQIQAATAVPGTNVASDAASASQGSASTLLRSDAKIVADTAAAVAVGTANAQGSSESLARADHVHDSPAPTTANKEMSCSVTSSDGDAATATAITSTPALDSYVAVLVNGISYTVGDGVKTKDCYFSNDGGTTARSISAIAATDTCHWNGSIAGFQLAASDTIDFNYIV